MCVDPLRGEEDGHIELTWEAYLETAAAICYRTKTLVALKNVWLILQRSTLTAQRCLSCQRRRAMLSSGLTQRRAAPGLHCESGRVTLPQRGKEGPSLGIVAPEPSRRRQWLGVLQAQRYWRRQEMPSSCAPAEIGTDLQDDRERSRQRSPALAALGSVLWRESYGTER